MFGAPSPSPSLPLPLSLSLYWVLLPSCQVMLLLARVFFLTLPLLSLSFHLFISFPIPFLILIFILTDQLIVPNPHLHSDTHSRGHLTPTHSHSHTLTSPPAYLLFIIIAFSGKLSYIVHISRLVCIPCTTHTPLTLKPPSPSVSVSSHPLSHSSHDLGISHFRLPLLLVTLVTFSPTTSLYLYIPRFIFVGCTYRSLCTF